ncbi:uncharacterized protein EV154DRAFT_540537 [Mucor mucedo]|uniref:uncharacterized protein n=1 Tax=Mucor mucedo TaxID=29922 RepID=UPI002221120E|nr:uncharacterized protein EV154DRAFT_540537 [Mucor mucedo]KAI7873447.1 hypothetical protein EV154DRAFT_540537 [Mucor mucedo]
MDNNNWRGRGRGRGGNRGGGGGGGNRNYDNDYDNDYSNNNNNRNAYNDGGSISITSRLGPTNSPINERIVHKQPPQHNDYNNRSDRTDRSSYDDQQQRGGRAFSSNNYRGRGGRGRGGANNAPPRFTREFVDEDIDMKPSCYPAGSEEKVLGFLTRKSKAAWEPLNIQYEQKSMQITVIDEQVADSLCRMNNFNFGNAVLTITKGGDGMSRDNGQTGGRGGRGGSNNYNNNPRGSTGGSGSGGGGRSAVLAEFLQERWNAEAGFLDMDGLPPTSHNIGVVISRLLNEAQHLFGDSVKTISFARNKLWSVGPLNKVAELFPNLQNLSIADNDIAEFRSLDKLNNKFNALQELMLSGNPIQVNNDIQTYQREVLKRFPTIRFLDVQPVSGTGGSIPQTSVEFPVPVRPNFFDQDSSSLAAQDLLSKYFPLFDTNRTGLLDLYDTQAIFSVVFSNGTYQQQNVWGSSQLNPAQRMAFGNENIVKRLLSLPTTVHDLSRADNFVLDAWQTAGSQAHPVVLFLSVHGEFVESPVGTPLSFDRTFLVAPSTPGSRAHSSGWGYVILSDSFIVRNYSCKAGSLITAS